MKIRSVVIALALVLLAAPAFAATKSTLSATNNTIAGPGSASVAPGGSETVFSNPGASTACVTVVNTGKSPVGVDISGGNAATTSVAAGGTKGVCSDDLTGVDLTCDAEEKADCTAQWRVDDN